MRVKDDMNCIPLKGFVLGFLGGQAVSGSEGEGTFLTWCWGREFGAVTGANAGKDPERDGDCTGSDIGGAPPCIVCLRAPAIGSTLKIWGRDRKNTGGYLLRRSRRKRGRQRGIKEWVIEEVVPRYSLMAI